MSSSSGNVTNQAINAKSPRKDESTASIFQRLHPRVYLERFLAEGVRPDGREPEGWRDVSVNVGSISTADGSALVRWGETTVVCGIKAEIAEPDLDTPHNGFLVPNLDLPAICSPKFKPGPPSEEAQLLSDRLNDVLVASDILPLSSLSIRAGKVAWVLYVDATCINYDGNVFDAALLAMIAALLNARLPKATYDEDTGQTTCSRKHKAPLQIDRLPISLSFGVFDSHRSFLLADPTSFEEPLLDTTLSVVLDSSGKLISASQLGAEAGFVMNASNTTVQDTVLMRCIGIAQKRKKEIENIFQLVRKDR